MTKLQTCARCGTPYLPERVANRRVLRFTYCGVICQIADGYREEDILDARRAGPAPRPWGTTAVNRLLADINASRE